MKKNLARVLGMEELVPVPAPVVLSEDQLLDKEQCVFEQYFEDHQHATEVAIESINNAHQLMDVVESGCSTDKTTYEILKVAVEQLKERTGVKTRTVALEDLSPSNYKTEALEDIKKFIDNVWEAIKKAFAAMVEKIKSFFKMLFDKEKNVEKEVNEVEKEIKEFEKEEDNLPKNEKQAETYKSDYFVKPTMLAIGHTPNTENKVHVKEENKKGFNTGEKQPEYSNKQFSKTGDFPTGVENFKFSNIVYRFLSSERLHPDAMGDLKDTLLKVLKFNKHAFFDGLADKMYLMVARPDYSLEKYILTDLRKSSDFIAPSFGTVGITINYGKVFEAEPTEMMKSRKVPHLTPTFIYENYITKIKTLFDIVNGYESEYLTTVKKLDNELARMKTASERHRLNNRGEYERLWGNFNRFFEFYVSYTRVFAQIKKYLIGLSKALVTFLRETMTLHKIYYTDVLKTDGYLRHVDKLNKLGYIEG